MSANNNLSCELAMIEAESLGWLPLEPGVYLHVGDEQATEVLVVGVPEAGSVAGGVKTFRPTGH